MFMNFSLLRYRIVFFYNYEVMNKEKYGNFENWLSKFTTTIFNSLPKTIQNVLLIKVNLPEIMFKKTKNKITKSYVIVKSIG